MKSPASARLSSEPVLKTRKMSHLCLSAGLLVLLGILAAGTQGQTTSSLPRASPPAFCMEPPYTGPCRALKQRWFFNATSRLCETFTYGGCRKKENNFPGKEECLKTCLGTGLKEPVLS
ncbi:pancreatic trypsin inhibitor-like [Manis javanica]|uniref:pancreatic trypsin inhibitor-like n=1 Tax=Manis javanica TaxID=9974 RepID=UPI003C6D331D